MKNKTLFIIAVLGIILIVSIALLLNFYYPSWMNKKYYSYDEQLIIYWGKDHIYHECDYYNPNNCTTKSYVYDDFNQRITFDNGDSQVIEEYNDSYITFREYIVRTKEESTKTYYKND